MVVARYVSAERRMQSVKKSWEDLVRHSEVGDIEIGYNGAERSLRGITPGRNNWLFFSSDNGRRTAATLTSFVATCKQIRINLFLYLRDVFQRISGHRVSRLPDLIPDNRKAAQTATQRLSA